MCIILDLTFYFHVMSALIRLQEGFYRNLQEFQSDFSEVILLHAAGFETSIPVNKNCQFNIRPCKINCPFIVLAHIRFSPFSKEKCHWVTGKVVTLYKYSFFLLNHLYQSISVTSSMLEMRYICHNIDCDKPSPCVCNILTGEKGTP